MLVLRYISSLLLYSTLLLSLGVLPFYKSSSPLLFTNVVTWQGCLLFMCAGLALFWAGSLLTRSGLGL